MQPQAESQIPDAAQTLAETCMGCARHSCSMLIESWTNGSLMIFDYFDTQHMFSSATILALSIFHNGNTSTSDKDRLECIEQFLSQLKSNGNFAASEFHQHISAITDLIGAAETQLRFGQAPTAGLVAAANVAAEPPTETCSYLQDYMDDRLACEITLEDPLFCNLLEQPATDLQFIDEASFADVDLGLSWYNTGI